MLVGVLVVGAQSPVTSKQKGVIKSMNAEGQLTWRVTREGPGERQVVHFGFAPGTGFTDLDFHPITEKNWKAMASPNSDAVAELEVPNSVTMAQLKTALQTLAAKGGYKTVEIVVRQQ
jgi:hypothetical protein